MKIKLSNWFPGECEFLWVVLVEYGSNENRLRVLEVDWMVCHACKNQFNESER